MVGEGFRALCFSSLVIHNVVQEFVAITGVLTVNEDVLGAITRNNLKGWLVRENSLEYS